MDNATAPKSEEKTETVVTEIPPALDKLLLLMVKSFYTPEQFILVYYIAKAICIKEEHLRARVHFDQKILRSCIAQLKADKLVRERLIAQKNANNRNVTMIFYFINYRALLNVLTYKIDHMRQRLEAKEKDSVQAAHYKCVRCGAQYEGLEMDRIFDIMTQKMTCWRCTGDVELDQTTGPTNQTRSLLARFNEQMLPMFTVIREMAGIQLAPHLYEPDINKYLDDPNGPEERQQLLDFSSQNPSEGAPTLGGMAFKKETGNRSNLANKETIIVDLNAGSNVVVEEQKAVPTWLTDAAIGGESTAVNRGTVGIDTLEEDIPVAPTVDLSMLAELEGLGESTEKESTPVEESATKEGRDAEEEDEEMSDDEATVYCEGKPYPLSEVVQNQEMVSRMSDAEKEAYMKAYMEEYSEDY